MAEKRKKGPGRQKTAADLRTAAAGPAQAAAEGEGTRAAGGAAGQEMEGYTPGITARVFGLSAGARTWRDVVLIRILSRDYNLLVLKDFMPVIGKVEGSVQVASAAEVADFRDIRGYYVFRQNEFELLIDEDIYVK